MPAPESPEEDREEDWPVDVPLLGVEGEIDDALPNVDPPDLEVKTVVPDESPIDPGDADAVIEAGEETVEVAVERGEEAATVAIEKGGDAVEVVAENGGDEVAEALLEGIVAALDGL